MKEKQDNRPNLFIIGPMRSGTTSLFELLGSHPYVYACPIKEPNYFTSSLSESRYTQDSKFEIHNYLRKRTKKPLHIAQIDNKADYQELFREAKRNHKYRLEASTSYFNSEESPRRIHEYSEEARIIFLIRNRLDRMLSHIRMDIALGRQHDQLDMVIERELEAYNRNNSTAESYLEMSLYASVYKAYKEKFPNKVLLVSLDQLLLDFDEQLERILGFLDLKQLSLSMPAKNTAREIKYSKILKVYYGSDRLRGIFSNLPTRLRHALFSLISRPKSKYHNIEPTQFKRLRRIFEKDQQLLDEIN